MELAENLFIQPLEKLEKLLAEDFHILSSDIKSIPIGKKEDKPDDYDQLIELLQYHDLIRQKVLHVQELNFLFNEEVENDGKEPDYKKITPELFLLMIELLRFSSQEYAKVAKHLHYYFIKLELSHGWQGDKIRLFYKEALNLIHKMEILYIQIGEKQERDSLQLITAQKKMQKIYQSFSMESERQIYQGILKNDPQFKGIGQVEKEQEAGGNIDLF